MSPTPLEQREFFKTIEPKAQLGELLSIVADKMSVISDKGSLEYEELNNLYNKINELMGDTSPESQEKRKTIADIYKNFKESGITEELQKETIQLMKNIFNQVS